MGIWLEMKQTKFFTAWGVFCAEYPVPMITFGVSVALALCVGMQFIKVTTDPVELWAAPGKKLQLFVNPML